MARARQTDNLPLRKGFIATDVTAFARIATFARLGVAVSRILAAVRDGTVYEDAYLRRGGPPPGPAIVAKLKKRVSG